MRKYKIRAILGLCLLYVAIFQNWTWVWGVMFLVWVIPDIRFGTTFFIEPVERKDNPILYWIIIFTWLSLSAYSLYFSVTEEPYGPKAFVGRSVGKFTEPDSLKLNDTIPGKLTTSDSATTETKNDRIPDISEEGKISLKYQTQDLNDTLLITGISMKFIPNSTDSAGQVQNLIYKFYSGAESLTTPDNLYGEPLYVVYNDYNWASEEAYTLSVGFKKNKAKTPDSMSTIKIKPSEYAVFTSNPNNYESWLGELWAKISQSDLDEGLSNAYEVYRSDKEGNLLKVELHVPIN
ncbi:hypothetical protein FUAX_17650 [Fulvitalea axinellae]|uniref:Integron-associated effector binding protein domain-containing protein n=1 Tax=Fulvitalea axinellae TaxID=1182444 RepID=A0AAU9CMT3_9BACT|nr:hypothetical protein FUAX_17650 [Fulvitalea axinellae]